jgi:DNA (cytosine-5)-methyltransferase 1
VNFIQQKTLNNRPVAIDLFSGCGGMSLGLEAAGFDIAASVEIDPIHSLVHHYNFPYGVTICQDISKLSSQELLTNIKNKGFKTDIDLIAGGPPCQGFSHMGKRQLDDPRNQLVFEYLRIISEIRPKYFIFENVPGIATGKHQKFLNELIKEFKKINYFVVQPIRVLDAFVYGAPQKRKRLILIGYRKDLPQPKYPAPTYGDRDLLPLTTVSNAISDLGKIPVFISKDCGINVTQLNYTKFRKSFNIKPKGEYLLCHQRNFKNKIVWGHLGSNHTQKSIERFANITPGKIDKVSRFFKLDAEGLSNTLRAGTASNKGAFTAPRPIHYQEPRCISIREAARLHTFPDWFQFHRTIWHGFREIGNAVVPLLAKSLGIEIIKCLDIDSSQFEINKLPLTDDSILSYNMGQAAEFWQVPNDVIAKRKKIL